MEFRAGSSISTVCQYCNTTVRRSDRGIENLGKQADLVDTPTIVAVMDRGVVAGKSFTVLGRVQLAHDMGGVWDEWYLGYDDGTWGWLAYAQGNYYVTWKTEPATRLPDPRNLQIESLVTLQPGAFRVAEIKSAKIASSEGELPFVPASGTVRYYADLLGPSSYFATIDWGNGSSPPELFVGYQVAESQLKITEQSERPRKEIKLEGLNCPNCGAPLRFRAGNRTERIACEHCSAISDSLSQKVIVAQQKARENPRIPLGSHGMFQGADFTVIGFVVRSSEIDGETFSWHEYLLFAQGVGFRWLVDDEGVWRFVCQQNMADLDLSGFPSSIRQKGRTFRLRNSNVARVVFVLGEFYWKVQVGERVQCSDYEYGSELISREAMNSEVSWSYSQPVAFSVIAAAFGLPASAHYAQPSAGPSGAGARFTPLPSADSSSSMSVNIIIALVVILVLVLFTCGTCAGACGGSSGGGSVRGGGTPGGWSGGK